MPEFKNRICLYFFLHTVKRHLIFDPQNAALFVKTDKFLISIFKVVCVKPWGITVVLSRSVVGVYVQSI